MSMAIRSGALRHLFGFAALAACLAAGIGAGPFARAAYDRLFPEPPFVNGDFSALYREQDSSVVVFTTSTCPYCRATRELLRDERADFKDLVTDTSPDADTKFAALGGHGVPLIFIGNRRIEGFRPEVIRESLALLRQTPH